VVALLPGAMKHAEGKGGWGPKEQGRQRLARCAQRASREAEPPCATKETR